MVLQQIALHWIEKTVQCSALFLDLNTLSMYSVSLSVLIFKLSQRKGYSLDARLAIVQSCCGRKEKVNRKIESVNEYLTNK